MSHLVSRSISLIYGLIPKKLINTKRFCPIFFGPNAGLEILMQPVITQMFGTYESNVDKAINDHTRRFSPKHIFVLGLHNGYTAFKLQRKFPESIVIGYEANPLLAADCKASIKKNKITNLFIRDQSIGYGQELDFHISGDDNGMVTKSRDSLTKHSAIEVNPPITLKTALSSHLDLKPYQGNIIIIDIEGFEEDIIDNENIDIFDVFDIVLIEYHSSLIYEKLIHKFSNSNTSWIKIDIVNKATRNSVGNGHVLFKKDR